MPSSSCRPGTAHRSIVLFYNWVITNTQSSSSTSHIGLSALVRGVRGGMISVVRDMPKPSVMRH